MALASAPDRRHADARPRLARVVGQAQDSGRSIPMRLLSGRSASSARRALIVGAGDAGEMMVREMMRSATMDYAPRRVRRRRPDQVRLDDPRRARSRRSHRDPAPRPPARRQGHPHRDPVGARQDRSRDRPGLQEHAGGPQDPSRISHACRTARSTSPTCGRCRSRTFSVASRPELDLNLISSYLRGKRVLVTGAGGSIGVRAVPPDPEVRSRRRSTSWAAARTASTRSTASFARTAGFTRLVQIIGDVINKKKLEGIFAMFRPQIVFHAGADKHVPLMEMNPDEAVFNNIVGTKNVLEVSNAYRAERVVCISTDKAGQPHERHGMLQARRRAARAEQPVHEHVRLRASDSATSSGAAARSSRTFRSRSSSAVRSP